MRNRSKNWLEESRKTDSEIYVDWIGPCLDWEILVPNIRDEKLGNLFKADPYCHFGTARIYDDFPISLPQNAGSKFSQAPSAWITSYLVTM